MIDQFATSASNVHDLDRNMSRLQLPIRGRQGSPLQTDQGSDNQPTKSSLPLRPRNPIRSEEATNYQRPVAR